MMVENQYNNNYLITKILRKLDQMKNFLEVRDFCGDEMTFDKIIDNKIKRKNYNKIVISLDKHTIQHEINEYELLFYILDKIILVLILNIETKNYYFTQETINDDLIDIITNPLLYDTNWYITMDTHLQFIEMIKNFYTDGKWGNLTIGDKNINTMECNYPKGIIFGTNYPIIINKNEIYESQLISQAPSYNIKLTLYYIDEFYAIRMLTDEKEKQLFLRKRKLKGLTQNIK